MALGLGLGGNGLGAANPKAEAGYLCVYAGERRRSGREWFWNLGGDGAVAGVFGWGTWAVTAP
jgi:hypothetical protein